MSKFEPRPFGKYFLTDRIAIGGMAEIYKAKTFGVDGFEKTLAIKKILSHFSSDPNFVTMLTDEAKLVVHLSHPNIVQVYDLGRVADDYFISMEYINGVNLRELLNRADELGEKIPVPVCLYIAAEVLKGLDYAHSKRDATGEPLHIVHRDVSPHNVLVSFDGEVKIVDFGIAKAALNASSTQFGTLKGKVTYMSPEQAYGKPIDGRADIFSTGLVLYEMLTGERLFNGETQLEVLEIIKKTRITAELLKNRIDSDLLPVLLKAFAYRTNERFLQAADMQVALTRLLFALYPDFTPRQLSTLLSRWFGKNSIEPSLSQLTPARWSKLREQDASLHQVTLVQREAKDEDEFATLRSGEVPPLTEPTPLSESTKIPQPESTLPKRGIFFRWIWGTVAVASLILFSAYFIFSSSPPASQRGVKKKQVAPAVAQTYSVQVLSEPPGATVFWDDADSGKLTPSEFEGFKPGQTSRLRLHLEGYEDFVEDVTGLEATDQVLDVRLTRTPLTTLKVNSTPAGASILINGHASGFVTPHDFNKLSGSQKVVVTLKMGGYKEKSEVISVGQNTRELAVHMDLERILKTYDVTFTANADDARVLLNGHELGVAPLTTNLAEGKYTLMVKRDGYKDVIRTFVVRDRDQVIPVRLETVQK